MGVPSLDDDDRRAGSRAAVANRRARAEVRARLAAREIDLGAVFALADRDPVVADMRVVDALTAVPRVGPTRARRILRQCHVAEQRRLKGLGERQRAALAAAVGSPHVGDRR